MMTNQEMLARHFDLVYAVVERNVHQAYHAGQLGLARRFAGLPGVIKGPGQKEAEAAAAAQRAQA